MILKLFTKKDCPKCPAAKRVVGDLKKKEIKDLVIEYFDVDSVDGMAEAAFYGLMSTPSILLISKQGKEVAGWRGESPSLKNLILRLSW